MALILFQIFLVAAAGKGGWLDKFWDFAKKPTTAIAVAGSAGGATGGVLLANEEMDRLADLNPPGMRDPNYVPAIGSFCLTGDKKSGIVETDRKTCSIYCVDRNGNVGTVSEPGTECIEATGDNIVKANATIPVSTQVMSGDTCDLEDGTTGIIDSDMKCGANKPFTECPLADGTYGHYDETGKQCMTGELSGPGVSMFNT